MDKFKDRLAAALEQANMSRADLSRKTGISESLLSHYASGKTTPRRTKLILIASALHVSPAWLLLGDEPITIASEDVIMGIYSKLNEEMKKSLINYAQYLMITQENDDVL